MIVTRSRMDLQLLVYKNSDWHKDQGKPRRDTRERTDSCKPRHKIGPFLASSSLVLSSKRSLARLTEGYLKLSSTNVFGKLVSRGQHFSR